jgi:hypothetical protein
MRLLDLVLKSFNKAVVGALYVFIGALGGLLVKRLTEVYSNSPPRQPFAGAAVDSSQHTAVARAVRKRPYMRETVFPTGVME